MPQPLPSYHFIVEWGETSVCFNKVRNLAMSYELMASNCGASVESKDELQLGRQQFENFFLERSALEGDNDFFNWWRSAERRDIIIKLLNSEHEPVKSWQILNAMPVRLSYSDLDASESAILVETLEVANEGIRVE